jgi:hypothetical protein
MVARISLLFSALVLTVILLAIESSLAAQLKPTRIIFGGQSGNLEGGAPPLLLGIKANSGALFDKYQVQVAFRNNADDVLLKDVKVAVYAGSFTTSVPDDATKLEIDASNLNRNLPLLKKGEVWPDNGIKFDLSAAAIPETVGCTPFNVTVDVTTTYSLDGTQQRERDLIPFQVSPNCLSNDNFTPLPSKNGTGSSNLLSSNVSITFASDYVQTTDTQIGFYVNFGGRVTEGNPLKLVNVTGTTRFDMLYAWETGEVFVVCYPEYEDKDSTISVKVKSAVTTYDSGFPNSAAEMTVQYKPGDGGYQHAAIVLTAVFAGIILMSWFTSFIVSSVQPWSTAGSLGYAALGFILWAQRFYLSGMISTEVMPANYKTMTDVFAWANFQAPLPWNWGSTSHGLPGNITTGNKLVFQEGSVVFLRSKDLGYSGFTTDSNLLVPPPPLQNPVPEPSPVQQPAVPDPVVQEPEPIKQEPVVPIPVPVPESPAAGQGVTSGQDSCSVMENTDLFGGDLNNGGISASDPQQCCNACLSDPKCFVWTFSFVDNKCYLKGQSGWQRLGDRTCCVSGTANRNGIPSITIDQLNGAAAGQPTGNQDKGNDKGNNNQDNKNQGNKNNQDNKNQGNKNNQDNKNQGNKNNQDNKNQGNKNNEDDAKKDDQNILPSDIQNIFNKPNRKLLLSSQRFRVLLQQAAPDAGIQVTPDDIRLLAVSFNDPFSNKTTQDVIQISGKDAGDRARYLVQVSADTKTESVDYYDKMERAAFWFGCLLGAGLIISAVSYTFVKCCEGEVPGVLYMPRIALMVLLFSLTGFSFAGAQLFSGGGGLGPVLVGILVVLFYPVLFLIASFVGVAAAIYRKRKAVYLLSSRTNTDEGETNKWDKKVVASWMGMSLNRGKWRPTDPSKKNEFVFRWGPIFEDCRGPLFQRKKVDNLNSTTSGSLRRTGSIVSDTSSQSGANTISESGMKPRRSSSRKKVISVEEKPMCTCCGNNWRRSNYQAYGTIFSLSRMCVYGLLIGGLGSWPAAQAGSCLGFSVLYLCYLRFSVPFSRRDEMALEYFIALVDIIIFGILLGLVFVSPSDFGSMDTFCIVLIVFQGLGMLAYLINRVLIIIHAWAEVICPACSLGAPSPKKSHRRRRSHGRSIKSEPSITYSGSSDVSAPFYMGPNGSPMTPNGNGHSPSGGEMMVAPDQANGMSPHSRTPSKSGPSFPVIQEEPVQQTTDVENREEIDLARGLSQTRNKGQNAVFDKFWRSL